EREPRGMGPAHPAHGGRELGAQPPRDGAEVPFVEIAHQDPGPGKLMRHRDEPAEEAELAAALQQIEAEMAVEDVQRRVVGADVDPETAARLTGAPAEIAPRGADHRQARE